MFRGIHTAIVTPFRNGRLDLDGYGALVERQIAAGVDGIVPVGTTGESSTLKPAERRALFQKSVEVAAGRCKVIAGVGTNDTAQSVEYARMAVECGADAGLVITPYYNKPTQEGLYHHCRVVAEAVPELPVVLYNVPARTGVSFTVETLDRLADVPGIVSLKEATADLRFGAEIVSACQGRMTVLSGDDATMFPLWAVGGEGVISVTSNLVPDRVVALWRAFEGGDIAEARRLHLQLLPLFTGLFIEANPVPVKTLVAWSTGLIEPDVRLPLTPLGAGAAAKLRALCAALEIPLEKGP